MNISQRLILTLTLCMLMIGLAAHSVSAVSLCACVEATEGGNSASGPDACLVCQLQTGILTASLPTPMAGGKSPGVIHLPIRIPLERADRISHPPILF
jgi:hypothetical protein